jgi:CDP-diacylglycerol--glycerol-3-phosphate 3-phosphatidyltransferase
VNIANIFSCTRLFFLPFFVVSLLYYAPSREYLRYIAIIIIALSLLSDALDGYLARKKGLKTELGAFLDPLGDKLLINAGFIILISKPEFRYTLSLPIWVGVVVFLRDVGLAIGSSFLHFKSKLEIRPSPLGKVTVVLQMLSILSALLYLKFSFLLWYLTGILTVLTGVGYLRREGPKFFEKR